MILRFHRMPRILKVTGVIFFCMKGGTLLDKSPKGITAVPLALPGYKIMPQKDKSMGLSLYYLSPSMVVTFHKAKFMTYN